MTKLAQLELLQFQFCMCNALALRGQKQSYIEMNYAKAPQVDSCIEEIAKSHGNGSAHKARVQCMLLASSKKKSARN